MRRYLINSHIKTSQEMGVDFFKDYPVLGRISQSEADRETPKIRRSEKLPCLFPIMAY